jgi:transcriptional regulator with XRE-family HTH domain
MSEAQKIIGACIRATREQRGLTQEALAAKAGISYQYLSGVETGKENFSIQVLENISNSLDLPVRTLMVAAYEGAAWDKSPRLNRAFFRPQVPLPDGLIIDHIEEAANLTQSIIRRMNRNMTIEVGLPLQGLIQGNNFSGLVSNIFSNSMDQCSPYKHNHDQRYPDIINKTANDGRGEGLEVKTTINIGKGGESHNGHGGWHVIACYNFLPDGDIVFVHIMFAQLEGHQSDSPDWSYVGSKVNEATGSRRTETYTTNGKGTTKLRDGSIYLNTDAVNFSRWRQTRNGVTPHWSIFAPQPI